MKDTLEYYLEHFYAEHSFEKNQDIEKGYIGLYRRKERLTLLAILPTQPRPKNQTIRRSIDQITDITFQYTSIDLGLILLKAFLDDYTLNHSYNYHSAFRLGEISHQMLWH